MGLHILDELVEWFSEVYNFIDRCLTCKHEMECILAPCEVCKDTQKKTDQSKIWCFL